MKKIILYIATSIDGFIADLSGGVDWLPPPESDPDDSCGYKSFIENISIIIMGSTSYNQILSFGEWAWPAKQTYVFTSQNLTAIETSISFVNEPPKKFVAKLKRSGADKDIWLLGGAKLAHSFFCDNLIDEVIITIVPVYLEHGIKLELPHSGFSLVSERVCASEIVQKIYHKTTDCHK
ncbi:MAG: deaminase [Legionella sp.]|jgi:dihydrofolate reductase|nr:MAG: deaminase [Legionella sp.]